MALVGLAHSPETGEREREAETEGEMMESEGGVEELSELNSEEPDTLELDLDLDLKKAWRSHSTPPRAMRCGCARGRGRGGRWGGGWGCGRWTPGWWCGAAGAMDVVSA